MEHNVNPTWRGILGAALIIVIAMLWIVSDGIVRVSSDRDALVVVTELLVLTIIGYRAQVAADLPSRRRRLSGRAAIEALSQRVAAAAAFAVLLRLGAFFLIRKLSEHPNIAFNAPPAFRPLLVFAIVAYFFWPELGAGLKRWRMPKF
jgi:hypothetical protein